MKASLIKNPFTEFILELSPFLVVKEFAYEFLFILSKPQHTYSLIHKFITAKRNFVIKKNNLMHVLACTRKPHHRSSSNLSRRHRS